ncbi:hypothetical protein GCM10010458_00870 [Microbacterium luteolum]|uniref:CU044_5270 family protein n=1 Tax=Microbacterium luteolum TaxID=69367 RepID=A0ABY7XLF1_MICLT|nr:hypothetical protein [Microbacterium luteolum]WDM42929.1 hypothetical protein KV395_06505 [Microbacterium luteolum]
MNVFEKVQEARPEIDGAEENISAARGRLLTEIHAEKRPARSRAARRPWIITAGLVGAAAAVTVGVLVVGNLTTPTTGGVEAIPTVVPKPSVEPTPEPTVEPLTASGAFSAAGAAASTFAGLTVAPGQYLRIQVDMHDVVFSEPVFGWGENVADRSNATNAWEMLGTSEIYVPADQHGEWRYLGTSSQTGNLYGPEAQQRMEQYLQELGLGSGPSPATGQLGGPSAPWPTPDGSILLVDFLESMPTDPAELITWIDDQQDTPPESQNAKVGWLLLELLAENVGSAGARSTMYAALSMLDGFELVSVAGNEFTVALVTPIDDLSGNPSTVRRTARIDMSTGIVNETTITSGSGSALVPDAVPDSRRSYSVSIVPTAP